MDLDEVLAATFSLVGGAVDVVARVVATVGRETLEAGAGVAWPESSVGVSSLKAFKRP